MADKCGTAGIVTRWNLLVATEKNMKGNNRKPAIQKQKTNLRIPHVYIYI